MGLSLLQTFRRRVRYLVLPHSPKFVLKIQDCTTKCPETGILLVMKQLKKLVTLLVFSVACLLVLGAFQDWWPNQYDAENRVGRGVRKLSAVVAVNSTLEQKSTIDRLTTRAMTKQTTKLIQLTKKPIVIPSTSKNVRTNKPTKSHKSNAPRLNGTVPKINSTAARLLVANAMLKSRPMKIINKDEVVRILLVTYFRGGSTFLGDILQQNWKTFYHFEPLHYMSITSRIAKQKKREAFDLLSFLFRCNFDPLTHYIRWAMIRKHQFLFRRNLFLWSLCHIHPSVCFTPYYLRGICLRSPIQVMKVTRLPLRDALEFINENRDLKIKVIYLTRDPRGIFSSRRVLDWCQKDGCDSPDNLCQDMSADAEQLKNNSESFKWLRYEDVCLDAGNITKSLYQWLGIPYTIGVANFLRSHTNARKVHALDPYSTRRNTTTVPFEWLHRLSFPEIQHIQTQCKNVMKTLKYKVIGNVTYHENEGPESVLE